MTLLTTVRMAHAMNLLATTNLTIGQISSLCLGIKILPILLKNSRSIIKALRKNLNV